MKIAKLLFLGALILFSSCKEMPNKVSNAEKIKLESTKLNDLFQIAMLLTR